jgi:hypothetical protein
VGAVKSIISRLPQTLIKRPKAFLTQLFLRLGGEVAIANDVNDALYAASSISIDIAVSLSGWEPEYAASLGVPLGGFFQTMLFAWPKDPRRSLRLVV